MRRAEDRSACGIASAALVQFVTDIRPATSASLSTRNPTFGAIISSQLWKP
jgi:hypothetical protein